jgi:hypothetical protein
LRNADTVTTCRLRRVQRNIRRVDNFVHIRPGKIAK